MLHWNGEIPCVHMSLRKLVMCDTILSAETEAIKQPLFPGKALGKARGADFENFLGGPERQLQLYRDINVCVYVYICILFNK